MRRMIRKLGLMLALAAAVVIRCDYSWPGVLLILLLFAAKDSRSGIAAVMIAFCLYWGSGSLAVTEFFGLPLQVLPSPFSQLLIPFLKLQGLAILALPLMLIRFPKDVKLPVFVSYALYPAHLVVLIILENIF